MNNNLETIRIFSEDVIPVYDTDTGEKVVLGRELHERLKIKTAYKDWFPRMCEYGFVDGKDYGSFLSNRSDGLAGKPIRPYYHSGHGKAHCDDSADTAGYGNSPEAD